MSSNQPQYEMIASRLQAGALAAFWNMIGECEVPADSNCDRLLQFQVEGWYKLWNEMTGDQHQPRWIKRAQS